MIKGLSDRLRELRWQADLSQREVAKKLDVSPSIISGYETGERTPSAENLLALSYLYRCSVDYLLGKEGRRQDAVLSVEGLTEREVAVIRGMIDCLLSHGENDGE